MADNTETNPGSGGDIFGSDDIGGVKYPRVKLIHGADGVNDGDVDAANPLPVEDAQLADVATETTLAAINTKIPASPATAANQQTDALTDAELRATPVDVDTGLTVQTDALTDTELRAAPVVVDLGANNDVTVTSGSITATQGTATNLKTQAEVYQGGSAVASGNPLQVTLANTGANSTAVKVDGSAVTQPVSYGTTGSGTATGAIRVELPTNGTGVVGLNAGTNAIGKLAANSGVDIGDVDVLTLGGQSPAYGAGATGSTVLRTVAANGAGKTILSKYGTVSSSGNNTIVSAGTDKLKVFAFSLTTTSTTAVTVKFQDGAGGTDLWGVTLQAPSSVNVGANLSVTPPAWIFATSSATLLNINLSSAQTVHYSVSYYDEA